MPTTSSLGFQWVQERATDEAFLTLILRWMQCQARVRVHGAGVHMEEAKSLSHNAGVGNLAACGRAINCDYNAPVHSEL